MKKYFLFVLIFSILFSCAPSFATETHGPVSRWLNSMTIKVAKQEQQMDRKSKEREQKRLKKKEKQRLKKLERQRKMRKKKRLLKELFSNN